MNQHVSVLLLITGLFRVLAWAAIAVIGYQQRRLLPFAFGTLAGLTSIVFAISNAHGEVPGVLTDVSSLLALPIVVLILMGVVVTRPVLKAPKAKRWHL